MAVFITKAFNMAFAQAQPIAFNEKWANGTGYFDHSVRGVNAPVLTEGEMVSSTSTDNRKIVIVGTRFGNVLVFQRYSDGEKDIYVCNIPIEVKKFFNGLFPTGALTEGTVIALLGEYSHSFESNIGLHFKKWLPALVE